MNAVPSQYEYFLKLNYGFVIKLAFRKNIDQEEKTWIRILSMKIFKIGLKAIKSGKRLASIYRNVCQK